GATRSWRVSAARGRRAVDESFTMCPVVLMPAVLGQDSRSSVLPRGPVGYLLRLAVLVALYDGAAQLSFHLEFAGPVAAIVWLPVGVGIAFLYFGGLHLWPGALAGDLMANDYGALTVGAGLAQSAGNLAEVIVATALIRRLV